MAMRMFDSPSVVISTSGLAGQSASQIWWLFSIVGFISGLGILVFIKSIWRQKRKARGH